MIRLLGLHFAYASAETLHNRMVAYSGVNSSATTRPMNVKQINGNADFEISCEDGCTAEFVKQQIEKQGGISQADMHLCIVYGSSTRIVEDNAVFHDDTDESSSEEELLGRVDWKAFAKAQREEQPPPKHFLYPDQSLYLLIGRHGIDAPEQHHYLVEDLQKVDTMDITDHKGAYIHEGVQGSVYKINPRKEVPHAEAYKHFNDPDQGFKEELEIASRFHGVNFPNVIQATGYTHNRAQGITYDLANTDFTRVVKNNLQDKAFANLRNIVTGVVRGLHSLHRGYWAHDDIKKDNLLLKVQNDDATVDGLIGDLGLVQTREQWDPLAFEGKYRHVAGPGRDLSKLGKSLIEFCVFITETDPERIERYKNIEVNAARAYIADLGVFDKHQPGKFDSEYAPMLQDRGIPGNSFYFEI